MLAISFSITNLRKLVLHGLLLSLLSVIVMSPQQRDLNLQIYNSYMEGSRAAL